MIRQTAVVGIALWIAVPLCAQNEYGNKPRRADWPRFLGRTYDGVVANPSSEIDWTTEPALVWSIEVGEGYGIGTVAGENYFQLDALPSSSDRRLPAAESEERLRCFDLASGTEKWSHSQTLRYRDVYRYEDGPRSSPTVVGQRVITLGVAGQLTCRNVADGAVLWTVQTNERYGVVQNFFGVGCSPLVLGDRVIVMIGGSPPEDQELGTVNIDRVSPNGSAVVAFDLATGRELWKCGDDLASYSSPRPIEIEGETLVLVFAREGLMAIDPQRGELRWRIDHRSAKIESVNAIVPVVDGNRVFISECYEVGSLLLKAGRKSANVLWQDPPRDRRRQSMRCHWATPILVDGFLYGCSGRNPPDSDLRCIDFASGEVQWIDPRRMRSSLTRAGNHLIVLEERGILQIIQANPRKFQVVSQWNLQLGKGDRPAIGHPCWSAPIVVGTKMILRGDQRVLCLDLAQR